MLISVKVIPNSRKPAIEKIGEGDFKVKVDEKAQHGKANRRLVEILAEHFKVPKSHVAILKGQKSRNKTIEISFK
ncbi:MAG TPA: DUF167 domain-containing protein [archaeon]|nr:DUF167 domain-containing protein [archaeon]